MKLIQKIIRFFSPYAIPEEKVVAKFFAKINENSSPVAVRNQLLPLIQKNIAVINLWTEFEYKGYKYLNKKTRRELYENLAKIAADFDEFHFQNCGGAVAKFKENSRENLVGNFGEKILRNSDQRNPEMTREISPEMRAKMQNPENILRSLTEYFSPKNGRYVYRNSSSFGRLLRDPAQEKLVGDCNQIVTLYIYIFSRYAAIENLRVRILPQHVALFFAGKDIEATNGTFVNYENREGAELMPIEEIVSINLLDVTDEYFAAHEISPEVMLQAARFAYILSHNRDVATKNLKISYRNLVIDLMRRNDFRRALKFAQDSGDAEMLATVGHNGAIFYISAHDFARARNFAEFALKRDELVKNSYQAEGAWNYNSRNFAAAIRAYERAGDQKMVQNCYAQLFFTEQEKLPHQFTRDEIRGFAGTIKNMQRYANLSGRAELMAHAEKLAKYL